MGGNEKGFKGIGGKGTRRQLRANEKGFKGIGGRGPGGNWETMGGKWGRMRRASKGLGDQEATGRELEPFEKAGRTAHPLRSYFLNTGKASRGSSSCSTGRKAESCPRNRRGGRQEQPTQPQWAPQPRWASQPVFTQFSPQGCLLCWQPPPWRRQQPWPRAPPGASASSPSLCSTSSEQERDKSSLRPCFIRPKPYLHPTENFCYARNNHQAAQQRENEQKPQTASAWEIWS